MNGVILSAADKTDLAENCIVDPAGNRSSPSAVAEKIIPTPCNSPKTWVQFNIAKAAANYVVIRTGIPYNIAVTSRDHAGWTVDTVPSAARNNAIIPAGIDHVRDKAVATRENRRST